MDYFNLLLGYSIIILHYFTQKGILDIIPNGLNINRKSKNEEALKVKNWSLRAIFGKILMKIIYFQFEKVDSNKKFQNPQILCPICNKGFNISSEKCGNNYSFKFKKNLLFLTDQFSNQIKQ
ncbi:hypothetical protein LCGC14_0971790 [marine sediment metagenome]|uniref:Uncharacterized protein n=1 Tax=marine sediment metagenome TaxID=412755 RepID=A0A0F9NFX0_9ZZZZ